jgi:hypothetical protein
MRPKARYSGVVNTEPFDFVGNPKEELLTLLSEDATSYGVSVEDIVNEMLNAARPFLGITDLLKHLNRKADLIKEQKDFQKALQIWADRLRHISPGILYDYRGVEDLAKAMEAMAERFSQAGKVLRKISNKPKPQETEKANADELARQAMAILHKHHIPVTASGTQIGSTIVYQSIAVKILATILKAVGLPHQDLTTRDRITRIKPERNKVIFNTVKSYFPEISETDIENHLSGFLF